MLEFASKRQEKSRPTILYIMIGVSVILAAGILLFFNYQRDLPPGAGKSSLHVPGLLPPGDTNFEYYKTRIRIEDVRASLGISFSNARIALISGLIVNDSDRKLEALELRITLFDAWGKVSKERTAFVVRPGAGLTGRPMEPLEKRTFSIGVEAVEYYWDPKEILVEIIGLKYR
ncbi:MAG TPA: hypothetical protein VLL97_08670 [Acidobacteriota bacterium]|nr:hypothetical protein [Acidobacteriota bacterium]